MRRALTFRIGSVILAFDLLFAVVGSLAFLEFLGPLAPGTRIADRVATEGLT